MEAIRYIFWSVFSFSNRLQTIGDKVNDNVTMKQWMFLAFVEQQHAKSRKLSLTEMAHLMGSSRQNIKKMAILLEKQGVIKLEKDKEDSRVLRICYLKECSLVLKQNEQADTVMMQQMFRGFSDKELYSLYQSMRKLEKNIADMEL